VTVDSITKADGMEGVRLVRFPGSVRIVLDDDALALIADALEDAAACWESALDGHRAALLAEVVRGSDEGALTLEDHDDGREDGVTTRRCAALVQALVDAGAQA
jgi:hypothetical protein